MFHRMLLIAILIQAGCATPAASRNALPHKKEGIPVADVHVIVEPLPGPLQVTK